MSSLFVYFGGMNPDISLILMDFKIFYSKTQVY